LTSEPYAAFAHPARLLVVLDLTDQTMMSPPVRERHETLRAAKFREVVEDGTFYNRRLCFRAEFALSSIAMLGFSGGPPH